MPNNRNSNRIVVPDAKSAIDKLKTEVANELGLPDYHKIDKGNLTARQNGYVGGNITRRLVEMAQRGMANK